MPNYYGRGTIRHIDHDPILNMPAWEVTKGARGPFAETIYVLDDVDWNAPGVVVGGHITREYDRYADALAVLELKRPHRASPVLALMRDGWDAGDPWGSGVLALGAITDTGDDGSGPCEVCQMTTSPDDGGALWYHPHNMSAFCDGDDAPDLSRQATPSSLSSARGAELITVDDMACAARILERYLDVCVAAGRDY